MAKTKLHEQVVESMVTAVVLLDHELRIRYLNPAAENLLQISATQAAGQPLAELILLDDDHSAALATALDTGQPYTERDARLRLPDQISQEVDFTVNVVEPGTATSGMLIELQPLNRLKRINKDEESVARQETATRLVRGLAHEVKNPLGGIRGAAQLLEQELSAVPEGQDLTEYTNVIISEADRLTDLVDTMLGPQRRQDPKPVNLHGVTERVIQLVEAERPGYIDWRRDYDPSLPELIVDEAQIIQAVLNIVRNACEALADTEQPTIGFRSRGIRTFTIGSTLHRLVMQLDITDNGPGIEPEMQERIFFPMISGRAEGTGLGLAITQTIINQHSGSIQVDSKPGNTTFRIYLPFEPPQPEEVST